MLGLRPAPEAGILAHSRFRQGFLVPDTVQTTRHFQQSDDWVIASLVEATHSSHEVVKNLYLEEKAKLTAKATVKNFIDVIAGRRVKQRLNRRSAI
jgi:Protein of unknown function (DUF3562)